MEKRNKKLLLVGGGTGGHVVPVFELYKKFKKEDKDINLLVVGGGGEIEKSFYGDLPEYQTIMAGKLHRNITLRNIIEFIKFVVGIFQAFFVLVSFKPDLIFSKGGYVSMPIIFWAKILKIPYYNHESDIEMGVTNIYAAAGALKVFVGYPVEFYDKKFSNKIEYVGQLINPDISLKDKYSFKLDSSKKTILILGGSQGAKNINQAVLDLPRDTFSRYNIIHQCGLQGINKAIEFKALLKESSYSPFAFLSFKDGVDQMKSAILESDLVVTRAGATTIAEVAALQKPMILVPYKHAAGDHQQKNADLLVSKKAVLSISDNDLTGESLEKMIDSIINDDKKQKELIENANREIKSDGLETVFVELNKKLEEL